MEPPSLFELPPPSRRRRSRRPAPNDVSTNQSAESTLRLPVDAVNVDPVDGLVTRPIKAHSRKKAHYVFRYADTVSRGVAGRFPATWWIEGFAGPGRLHLQDEGSFFHGSPLEAVRVRRPFTGYLFNDASAENAVALKTRLSTHPNAHVANPRREQQRVPRHGA